MENHGRRASERMSRTRGLRHFVRALGFSVAGFRSALRHESAFRQELVLFPVLTPAGLWLGEDGTQRALLVALWPRLAA